MSANPEKATLAAPAASTLPGEDFIALAEYARATGDFSKVSDEAIARIMTAAVTLYAAKAEAFEATPAPIVPDQVTPTDVVVVVSEMVRAAGLNLFDLSMWFRRAK